MSDKFKINNILDKFYGKSPDERSVEKALSKLNNALETAKMEAVFFGSLTHKLAGTIYIATRMNKLILVDFGVTKKEFIAQIEKTFGQFPHCDPSRIHGITIQVQDYLNGKRNDFDISLDLNQLTNFQRQVLMATLKIPRGQLATYGEIAHQIGNPKSVRAVGQALGRNPMPIVIPCHRVIASDGSLGGYSGGGGLETKVKLLRLEGAPLFA